MLLQNATADDLVTFMQQVWEGGPLYNEYHNANKTAKKAGFVWTGSTKIDGYNAMVYRKASHEGVLIWDRGKAIRKTHTQQKRIAA